MIQQQEDQNSGRRSIDAMLQREVAELRGAVADVRERMATTSGDVAHIKGVVEVVPEALQALAAVQARMAAAIEATQRVESENRVIETRLGKVEEEVNRNCAICERLWSATQWASVTLIVALGTGLWWFIQKHLERGL